MKRFFIFLLVIGFSVILYGQRSVPDSLAMLFNRQLEIFPQEKIYLHTDKPYYVSGEKIWFRAYLVDAITHIPTTASRYVYVELFNPIDSVVVRVKIRPDETDAYYGCLSIPVESFEGSYTLRAYTTFMRNLDEHYWYTKTIHIGHFGGKDSLDGDDLRSGKSSDFSLSFYPEGGALIEGRRCKVAFKAMKSNGQSTDVSGIIYDQRGAQIGFIKSDHLGMGCFLLSVSEGERYYVLCHDEEGEPRRFDLPVAINYGYALSVNYLRDSIYVSVNRGIEAESGVLYLFAHTRGMIHFVERFESDKEGVVFPKSLFPSGVLHLILFDSRLQPVSERLLFVYHRDQVQVAYSMDRERYTRRSLVTNRLIVTDLSGFPVTGSFSVSVTSDREVVPDSTTNILTQLLLTSDLRGHIENPAYYFRETPESAWALDLLMCIQGWRRYEVTAWAQGRFIEPSFPVETGSELSGMVKGGIRGRPVKDAEVLVVSSGYFGNVYTGGDGYFRMPIGELPDSTYYMVSVEPQNGMTRLELLLEGDSFPAKRLSSPPSAQIDKSQFKLYVDKVEEQYNLDEGIRVAQLQEAVVIAERKAPKKNSQYYSNPDASITAKDIENIPTGDIVSLLRRFPGVEAWLIVEKPYVNVVIRGVNSVLASRPPLVIVDDITVDIEYLMHLNVNNIAQIDILKSPINTSIFGVNGGFGVIAIYTKQNADKVSERISESLHIKTISPLGYQPPVEFYVPKYENQEQYNNLIPDLRTTIHWQPVMQTDSRGVASFEFYTADEATTYTVRIEGLANDGSIINKEEKISVL